MSGGTDNSAALFLWRIPMAQTPESGFRSAVEKYLPTGIYVQGNTTPFRSGTPDRYYEGPEGVLWVEYKYFPKIPRVVVPRLTELQRRWLERAREHGVNVAVIAGSPKGGVWYDHGGWNYELAREDFEQLLRTRQELADFIARRVL